MELQRNTSIEWLKPQELQEYKDNPRDNEAAVEMLAESIEAFGFNVPVLIDNDNVIIAGHTRKLAAEKLGLKKIPCIRITDLSDEAVRQYRIIDNKTQELAGWNIEKLFSELGEIDELDMSVFHFAEFDNEKATQVEPEDVDYNSNLDEGFEIDLTEFEDEAFNRECPYCGFRWTE